MEIHLSGKYNVMRLQKWLEYEIPSALLILGGWLYPIFFFLYGLAAIIFIPVMLKILYEEKKYGWIVGFFIFVVMPAAFIYFVNIPFLFKPILGVLPLLLFLFYCFLLKHSAKEWMVKARFKDINISDDNKLPEDVFNNKRF